MRSWTMSWAAAGRSTEEEQGAIEDVFGDASGDEDVAIERAWLSKELAKGLGAKGTEAVTAAVADPKLTAARARELRDVGGRPPEPGGGSGARGPVVKRDELDMETVDKALMMIKAGIADRLNKHGNGAFAGRHEAVGIIVEVIRRTD